MCVCVITSKVSLYWNNAITALRERERERESQKASVLCSRSEQSAAAVAQAQMTDTMDR